MINKITESEIELHEKQGYQHFYAFASKLYGDKRS